MFGSQIVDACDHIGVVHSDVVPKYSTMCDVVWIDAEDPLFLLCTSGRTEKPKLELLVTTLTDLNTMDGKWNVSLLTECSSSLDVNTRYIFSYKMTKTCFFNEGVFRSFGQSVVSCLDRLEHYCGKALANALSAAPSMWTLGNAGMRAL
uniref:Uncharacterized protein n=1 Tax=Lactuca sativa TaxID=4236 RepID=A0A9R1WV39_LACSA|nr:hypothetical protein LSAT_V11C900482870 [Lactuca sativa]